MSIFRLNCQVSLQLAQQLREAIKVLLIAWLDDVANRCCNLWVIELLSPKDLSAFIVRQECY
jgi:hypothetical protein